MTGKGFGWITIIYIFGVFLGSSFDNYTGSSWGFSVATGAGGYASGHEPMSVLQYLFQFSNAWQNLSIGPVTIPWVNPSYFIKWLDVLLLDFTFMPIFSIQWMLCCSWIVVIAVYTISQNFLQMIRGNITWGIFLFMPVCRYDLPKYNKKTKKWVWEEIKRQ